MIQMGISHCVYVSGLINTSCMGLMQQNTYCICNMYNVHFIYVFPVQYNKYTYVSVMHGFNATKYILYM